MGVVHPVTGPRIDSRFPHAIAAESVIAEISKFDAGDAANDGRFSLVVTQALEPIYIKIFLPAQRQIVFDPIFHFRLLTNDSQ